MPKVNFLLAAATALIPLIIGFIWYHKSVFGNAWIKESGVSMDDGKKVNMPLIFGLTYVFSFLLSVALHLLTIHQFAFSSLAMPEMNFTDPDNLAPTLKNAAEMSAEKFRTFRHGAITGIIDGIVLVLPIIGVNALFERKSWKYILINVGFWTVCISIMGGVICQWA